MSFRAHISTYLQRVRRFGAMRLLLLCLALAGHMANTAQAHIYIPGSETVEVRICGLHGDRTVEMTFGEDQPVQFTDDSCCGPCLTSAVPAVAGLSLPSRDVPRAAPVISRRGNQPLRDHSIWPGAPPIGPPELLES